MIYNGVPLRGKSDCPILKRMIVYILFVCVCVCVGVDLNVDSFKLNCI